VVIGGAIAPEGALFEHVLIEHAGSAAHDGRGSITVYAPFADGRVSLRDVTVRAGAQRGIDAPFAALRFGAFERVSLAGSVQGARLGAQAFAALGEGNDLGDEVELTGGTITRSGRFPATRRPITVRGPIAVEASTQDARTPEPATLVIEAGSSLRFARGTWLAVGERGPGALRAEHVTFSSADEHPAPGSWVGLVFGEHSRTSRVASSTIEYAGADDHAGDGAITFVGARSWLGLDVSLFGLTFRHVRNAHVSSNGEGCERALDPRSGFTWEPGVEFCR
jgi:hypothetical protein